MGLYCYAVLQMIFDQIFTGIINAKYHFDGGSSIGIFVSTLKYNNPIYTFGLKNLLDVLLRIYCDIMLFFFVYICIFIHHKIY